MTRSSAAIDPATVRERVGNGYPSPYNEHCEGRRKRALGDAGGLTQYGVNLVTLGPGEWSAQRHWHSHEDEFAWIDRERQGAVRRRFRHGPAEGGGHAGCLPRCRWALYAAGTGALRSWQSHPREVLSTGSHAAWPIPPLRPRHRA